MSETALRNVNAVLLSDRRSSSGKKGAMKVKVTGPNDENLDICQGKGAVVRLRPPVVLGKTKSTPNAQVDTPAEQAAQDIEYVSSEDLIALEDPQMCLSSLLLRLDSKEWLTVLEALNHVRQLAVYHRDCMLHILDTVVSLVIKALKNPRSALCKTAIMASTDLFTAYQDLMLDILDPLLLQLLLKASQDKRFVCEEAERALSGMTSSISPYPSLEKLRPYVSHRNPRVRAKAATLVYKSVSRLGVDGICKYGMEPLIQIAAAQLNDHLPEAREAARKLVVDLHAAYQQCNLDFESPVEPDNDGSHEVDAWEHFCISKLAPTTAQAVLRVTCFTS